MTLRIHQLFYSEPDPLEEKGLSLLPLSDAWAAQSRLPRKIMQSGVELTTVKIQKGASPSPPVLLQRPPFLPIP